ncbi:MAG: hypothetical protein DRP64_04745, partial [Verrucomicrobia bacterium]
MPDGRFPSFFNRLHSHPRLVATAVVVVLLLSAAGLFSIPFRHSMDVMLPAGSDTQESVSFLQSMEFSAKVALSFSQLDNALDRTAFFAEIDRFADSIDTPMIQQVLSTFDNQQMVHDIGAFLERAPELLGEAELEQLEQQMTREGVAHSLRKKYIQLLKPEGSFMGGMIRRDPLDIQMMLIEKIRALSASFGYDMRMENNHLVSADGKQVLLILETSIPFTDATGSHELVDYINQRIEMLPPSIRVDLVCGHLHTISNEKIIKHDISLTVTLASAAFILLFLFFFRDWRANLIFFIPFAALLVAVNITALVLGTLSPMMLGFGSVIAGIAVDYGIHVYVAVQRSGSALEAVRSVARPIVIGALTTAGVFAAFFFSSIPGYHQLASFALISVVLSVAGALFILPLYLVPKGIKGERPRLGKMSMPRAWIVLGIFVALMVAAFPVARKVQFDSDIMRLDGTEQSILETENRFQETWGSGGAGQAVAVVTHADYEAALDLNDRVYDVLIDQVGSSEIASLSPIWKSYANRKGNAARWNEFWSAEQKARLKKLFQEEGEPFGFAPDAFDPFFKTLDAPVVEEGELANNVVFSQIKSRFVQQVDGETQVLTFFPDEPGFIEAIAPLKDQVPGMLVISRSAISTDLAQDYTREFSRISLVALGLVLLVSGLLLKNLRKTLIVLTPALAGVASIAVLVEMVGSELNVMNLVSGIIVIGLCVDYGIFYVHSYTHSLNLGTRTAITLSAGTTLIGAGALLFTLHPALFSVGLTLVGGISAGYATSMWVVPALCSLFLNMEGEAPSEPRKVSGSDGASPSTKLHTTIRQFLVFMASFIRQPISKQQLSRGGFSQNNVRQNNQINCSISFCRPSFCEHFRVFGVFRGSNLVAALPRCALSVLSVASILVLSGCATVPFEAEPQADFQG